METIYFKPFADTDGEVVGYLHTPIAEMETRRETFPSVVICPGGGYEFVSAREADPVALRFFAAGYQVFILTYSVGEKAQKLLPLKELSETLCILRGHEKDWHVDPTHIAVCGFSAGGHLAASLGTLWNHPKLQEVYDNKNGENRPDAMILSYAVLTADEFAHEGSIRHVSGSEPGTPDYAFFSLDKQVTKETCPAFLWHTVPDDCVPVENTLRMLCALQKNHISYEAHLFPAGGHGISVCSKETGTEDAYNARWVDMGLAWLNREFGYTL